MLYLLLFFQITYVSRKMKVIVSLSRTLSSVICHFYALHSEAREREQEYRAEKECKSSCADPSASVSSATGAVSTLKPRYLLSYDWKCHLTAFLSERVCVFCGFFLGERGMECMSVA